MSVPLLKSYAPNYRRDRNPNDWQFETRLAWCTRATDKQLKARIAYFFDEAPRTKINPGEKNAFAFRDANRWSDAAAAELTARFAASRGWRCADWVSLRMIAQASSMRSREDYRLDDQHLILGFDHPQYFRYPDRPYRAAAVLIHTYQTDITIAQQRASVESLGIAIEQLPFSWYYPKRCKAFVFFKA